MPSGLSNTRIIQNCHIVWLDQSIDEVSSDDCRNSIMKLRQIVNTVKIFVDMDECLDFITDHKEEKAFMVLSGDFGQTIAPIVQDISEVSYVYIFGGDIAQDTKWLQQCSKIIGVYTNITLICESLKEFVFYCEHKSMPISFIATADELSSQTVGQLDQSFMYTQILKDILLAIEFDQLHLNEFFAYFRGLFAGNSIQLETVDKIENEYHDYQPVWWYTYPCFLYSTLNRTLRLMEVDFIIMMGVFIQALHKNIKKLYEEQFIAQNHSKSLIVYRGQGLSQKDFDRLKTTRGGLLSFNCFLSTTLNRAVSYMFADIGQNNSDLIGVLFEITVDPSISSCPFANVTNVGYFREEEEILFSMHSVFRIGKMEPIENNDRLWQVELRLTADNDPQLYCLTEIIRKETYSGFNGWDQLGEVIMQLHLVDKAEELYEILLEQATTEEEKGHIYHQLGEIKYEQGHHAEAIKNYEKSIAINQTLLPTPYIDLAASYNNSGNVYNAMGEYSTALLYYERAHDINQKILPANHPHIANLYNALGVIYGEMGEYLTALTFHEKALVIREQILPLSHPSLAESYCKIGIAHENMSNYADALLYYERSMYIFQKTLPKNHPNLGTSYACMGSLYNKMGEHAKAFSFHNRALEIQEKVLSTDHPNMVAKL